MQVHPKTAAEEAFLVREEFHALVHTLRPYKSSWVQKVLDNAVRSYMRIERADEHPRDQA